MNKNIIRNYTIIGACFGLMFPVGAYIVQSLISGVSLISIGQLHTSNPLLFMIDSAPIFLGLFAMVGGIAKAKTEVQKEQLKQLVEDMQQKEVALKKSNDSSREHIALFKTLLKELEGEKQTIANVVDELSGAEHNVSEIVNNIIEGIAETESTFDDLQMITKDYISYSDNAFKVSAAAKTHIDGNRETIHEMSEVASLSKANYEKLKKQITLVENSVSVIQEVSDEIDLLALNASIEASRAGEAGKGFVVVSQEIKKLVHRTESIVKEVKEEIGTLDDLIKMTNVSINRFDGFSVDSEKVLHEITGACDEIHENVSQIADSSKVTVSKMSDESHVISRLTGLTKKAEEEIQQFRVISREIRDVVKEHDVILSRILAATE